MYNVKQITKQKCSLGRKLPEGKNNVENIKIETRREINYLSRMNLADARTWFRYRSKMTKRVKGNKSSAF